MTTIPDTIEREIIVAASQERVYAAISDPTQITQWFPDMVEGSLTPGEQPIFIFEGHGKTRVLIVDARPVDYFAFRWIPGSSDVVDDVTCVPTTLVEFTLEAVEEQTKIFMKESGFAQLPMDVAQEKFDMNSGGWGYMMGRLETFLA
jgi:uncharacterized protein YndB with AHSA1/START domain